jgi:Gpi18-like mannosyltransferase
MSDSASKEARRTGRSTESILAPIRARLAALGSDERVQRWRWVAFPFTLWAVTRVAILGFGKLSMTLVPGLMEPAGRNREYLLKHPSIEGLCRWDCGFFQELANHGYLHEGYTNFFPLYPLLVRGLHEVTGLHIDLCLILVPNLAALGGFLVLYRLVTFIEDESAAKWTLMLFISFPFAFFQAMAYPESLMVLFTALAVYFALRGNHIWAGVALGRR